ncbi:MAG TPA: DUF362 domain-containing protein [Verrucomicrobiae bacterium]|nr:DUF362 domain-containing protein [Verrucomicrobiae bacterium]
MMPETGGVTQPETQRRVPNLSGLVAAGLLLAVWCASGVCAAAGEATNTAEIVTPQSRVVLVRDSTAVSGFTVDAAKARGLVAAGIKALTGEKDEAAAWRHFVSSNDVVGIKIDTQPGPLQSTRRPVVDAIAQGLCAAGVPGKIYVFDRDPLQMRTAGYLVGDMSRLLPYQVHSIISDTGWDPSVYFQSNLAGKLIWGDLLFGKEEGQYLSDRSHLPKLVTQTITKLINVPVLQDHDACGLMGCLYNVSLGMADNTRRFETMGQHGDPMIAQICALPPVRQKLVLNIMDGLLAGYAGGPDFKPQYSWNYGALYFSADPVAIDSLCVEALDAKRREANVPPIGSRANHIATAAHLGLGQNERPKIELSEVNP